MEPKPVSESTGILTHWMGIGDANSTGEVRHTDTAYLTMAALDKAGNPAPVPPVIATTPAEQRRMREAELRRANRITERAQLRAHREGEGETELG
jgi:hypothetical protein